MRNLTKFLVATAIVALSNITFTSAQEMPPLPIDKDVRIGKLDNGLTYYIRKNSLPENRADFYIAQKVGSIQEEPEQSGLAHFLEHMCFNGTKNFPGNGVREYLETIGVKFGVNLNAYTSVDETVYNISNVPVIREGAIDSCLLILHDWSNALELDPKEIDKERGVIHEEWRNQITAPRRLQQKALPKMFAGTKYENCFPIGDMDVVLNFKYQTLRDYYEKWYRPDLQGIVVVGDIDVDAVEAKIKKTFSDIPAQPNAAERIYYPVTDNAEPIIVIEKDKEQPNFQILYFNKHEAMPREMKSTSMFLVDHYAKSIISLMVNARLNELRQSANPPFIYAGTYDGDFFVAKTKAAFTGIAACKEDDILGGFEALAREIERAHRFGFTESEYNRARSEYLRALESEYNERNKKKNDFYVDQYVRHFLDNEPIPGIEFEYSTFSEMAPHLPVALMNQYFQSMVTGQNQVVALFGPEKEGVTYPTEEQLAEVLKKVKSEELTAYEDKVSDEPLITELPTPGTIVSEKKDDIFGTTSFVLSNGAKVIVKQTDFKDDEIQMKAVSLGGTSLFPDSEMANIQALIGVVTGGGLGNFSAVELEKALAGKMASATPSIGNKTEAILGNCSPKDFETMMQLTYLRFTAPRRDEEAFTSYKNRTKASLQNQELYPMVTFSDSVLGAVYMNHPRAQRLKSSMVDALNYDKIMEMYADRYKDASDFTFIFIGNIDPEQAKPFFEQYLASLPAINRKETFADNKMDMRQGMYKNEFIREQENPKSSIYASYNGACAYNLRNNLLMSITDQILTLIYTEKVREDEGGSYGVSVGGDLSKYNKEEATLEIMFETAPSKQEKLMQIVFDELENLGKNGPSEVNLSKTKEYMLKQYTENTKENGYWLGIIDEYLFTGVDMSKDYEAALNSITGEDVQQFVGDLLKQGNRTEVIMVSPEKQ